MDSSVEDSGMNSGVDFGIDSWEEFSVVHFYPQWRGGAVTGYRGFGQGGYRDPPPKMVTI